MADTEQHELEISLLEKHLSVLVKIYEDLSKSRDVAAEEQALLISGVLSNAKTEIAVIRGALNKLKYGVLGGEGKNSSMFGVIGIPQPWNKETAAFDDIKKRLLRQPPGNEERPPVVLSGLVGSGKSALAAALAHDEQIRNHFNDGIYWVRSSPEPDLIRAQIDLIRQLGGDPGNLLSIETGAEILHELFSGKMCLVVLDDVWDMQDVQAFYVTGRYSQLLIATSNEHLFDFINFFSSDAKQFQVVPLTDSEAANYIAQVAEISQNSTELPFEVDDLAHHCAGLPLSLRYVGISAKLQGQVDWGMILNRLAEDDGVVSSEHPRQLLQGLHIVLEYLGDDAECYLAFGVFREYWRIPIKTALMLWNYLFQMNDKTSSDLLNRFAAYGLLDIHGDIPLGAISLHGFQHAYMQEFSDIDKLHGHLLSAYLRQSSQGWVNGPNDGYFFDHLCKHLAGARRNQELKSLLLDFEWLQKKLRFSTMHSLLEDYALLEEDSDIKRVNKALQEMASSPLRDDEHLASNLLDSMFEKETKEIIPMLNQAKELVPGWVPPFPEKKRHE